MTMNRIVGHHTGGPGTPTADDLNAYHRIVDAAGGLHDGRFPISANAPGRSLAPGTYAPHTRGLNTGAIGLAMAAMGGASWNDPVGSTRFYPTELQVTAFIREAARLCRVYGITPTRKTVLTHAEVQLTLGVTQANKWDFDYPVFGPTNSRDPLVIGNMMRALIRDELDAQEASGRPVTREPIRLVLRRGMFDPAVRALQARLQALGFDPRGVDGHFGPGTFAALVAFQCASELLPDGIAGPATLTALNL